MTGSVMMARRLKCRHLVAFYSVLISLSICCCCAVFSPFYVHLAPHFPAHVNSLVDCCEGRKYTFGSDICCSGRCRPLRTVLVKGITIFKCCTRLVSHRAAPRAVIDTRRERVRRIQKRIGHCCCLVLHLSRRLFIFKSQRSRQRQRRESAPIFTMTC